MPDTILTIVQKACEREGTAPPPAKLFGTNDKIARIARRAVEDTMREYLRISNFVGLSEFHSTWIFALQPGTSAYKLPPDYLRMIPDSEHRQGWALGLIGPVSPVTWSEWLYSNAATVAPMGWRIINNNLWIEPRPSEAEIVAIEYISRYPVVSPVREGDFNLNLTPPQTNTPFVPREGYLKLPDDTLLRENGTLDGRYEDAQLGWDVAQWPADPHEVLRRISPLSTVEPLPQVRRPEFEVDDDYPAFEDTHMLSLGITFRIRRALGKPFSEIALEYEDEKQMKAATDAGGAREIHLDESGQSVQTYPLGDGQWLVT